MFVLVPGTQYKYLYVVFIDVGCTLPGTRSTSMHTHILHSRLFSVVEWYSVCVGQVLEYFASTLVIQYWCKFEVLQQIRQNVQYRVLGTTGTS